MYKTAYIFYCMHAVMHAQLGIRGSDGSARLPSKTHSPSVCQRSELQREGLRWNHFKHGGVKNHFILRTNV